MLVIPSLLPDCIIAKQFIKVLKRQPWKKAVTNAEFSKNNRFFSFMFQGLFIQKCHKLVILLLILKALIA